MPKAPEMLTTNVSLILGPRGIKLDERGRIRFVDPDILQALISGSNPEAPAAGEGNTIQCACNNYQCGRGLSDLGKPAEIGPLPSTRR